MRCRFNRSTLTRVYSDENNKMCNKYFDFDPRERT